MFNLEDSKIYQAVQFAKRFDSPVVKFLRMVLKIAGVLGLLCLAGQPFFDFSEFFLGFLLVGLTLALGTFIYEFYFYDAIKNVSLIFDQLEGQDFSKVNLADFLSFEAAELLSNFTISKPFLFILLKAGITPQQIQSNAPVTETTGSPNWEPIITQALEAAQKLNHQKIEVGDVVYGILLTNPQSQKILDDAGIKSADLLNIVYWQEIFFATLHKKNFYERLSAPTVAKTAGGIGRSWTAGYTPTLDRLSRDLTSAIEKGQINLHYLAHQKEIEAIETILARSGHHNVVLVGEPGIGKKTIVAGFAHRVHFGQTLRPLIYKRVVELDVGGLLSSAGTTQELQQVLVGILNEAVYAGNIILFIHDIDQLFGASEGKIGKIDATEIFLPYLRSPVFQCIATIDFANFHRLIETNSTLVSVFEKIEVQETDAQATIRILEEVASPLEARTGIVITYQALKEVIDLGGKFQAERRFPQKAIDLLDEACVWASTNTKDKLLTREHIDEIISQKTKVPVGEVQVQEKDKLLNLETQIHQRIINQKDAVEAVANALRRARSGLKQGKKPIGSFLFLGPTGVGKTELSKALAEVYFGAESAMVRFDMSEYQTIDSLARLIGNPNDQAGGQLANAIREKPFTLVLLDEIEKAHANILNLFLQVLDEGFLTDALGRKVDFSNAIIIATSNAGAEFIRENIQKIPYEQLAKSLLDFVQKQGIFKPEFLNRFDGVIAFRPLTPEEIVQVVDLMLNQVSKELAKQEIKLEVSQETKQTLAQKGYDPQLGARPLRRVIQEKVENRLAEKMLKGEIKKGDVVTITPQELG